MAFHYRNKRKIWIYGQFIEMFAFTVCMSAELWFKSEAAEVLLQNDAAEVLLQCEAAEMLIEC